LFRLLGLILTQEPVPSDKNKTDNQSMLRTLSSRRSLIQALREWGSDRMSRCSAATARELVAAAAESEERASSTVSEKRTSSGNSIASTDSGTAAGLDGATEHVRTSWRKKLQPFLAKLGASKNTGVRLPVPTQPLELRAGSCLLSIVKVGPHAQSWKPVTISHTAVRLR
jgi:hypothetical protein